MCWVSYNIPIKKTATEDITCYKLFARESIVWKKRKFWFDSIEKIVSLCMAYEYTPYKANPKVNIFYGQDCGWLWKDSPCCYIDEGYHSYATLSKVKRYINVYNNHYYGINKINNNYYIIVKCIIPKGSEYYINDKEEIVSSNIIVTDKIVK